METTCTRGPRGRASGAPKPASAPVPATLSGQSGPPGPPARPGPSCPGRRAPAPPCVEQLVRSSGEEESWEVFVQRYQRWLHRRCWYTLRRWSEAPRAQDVEELVQEVYCRLLEGRRRRLRSFRGEDETAWKTFLSRIVRTVVVDHVREVTAGKRRPRPWDRPPGCPGRRSTEESARLDGVPCLDPSPEHRIRLREDRRRLLYPDPEKAGRRSARRNAEILWLALLEGWSSREIADHLSMRPSTVDTVIHRARLRLAADGLEMPRRGSAIMAAP